MSNPRRDNKRSGFVFVAILLFALPVFSDETHTRYFDQLRRRGLFSLAESEAIARLASDKLSLEARTAFTIELSRTLSEHATDAPEDQRSELWERARTTIQELLNREPTNPRSILLKGQLAATFANEADWLRSEREVRPFDESLRTQALAACSQAIERWQIVERTLSEPSRDPSQKKNATGAPSAYELRTVLHQARWELGLTYRNRAELAAVGSSVRMADLANADQAVRRLSTAVDEPLKSRATLLRATCYRLKEEFDKANEIVATLMNGQPPESLQDEITVERVRLLIDRKRPSDAVELLVKTRTQRQRLTGELWFLRTKGLIILRTLLLQKQQESLAVEMAAQIQTSIDRCDQQIGGYWSRRCRQIWENAQTAEKYGEDLDALMQQARFDFNAGRIDAALAEYASAETMASERGRLDLAMDLGFTRASIQLEEKQFEPAAAEFVRLSGQYPTHANAGKAHLLGVFCLGKFYEEKKTQARREAYSAELDRHLKDYPNDPTINDARFLKAQLEEQRLQATVALPLYLQIDSDHPRASDATAGAARCYESILLRMNERRLPFEGVKREAVDRLSRFLDAAGTDVSHWKAAQAEVAVALAGILLIDENPRNSPNDPEADSKSHESEPNGVNRFRDAILWLDCVDAYASRKDDDPTSVLVNDRLRKRAAPLLIVALAGLGKTVEAERRLSELSTTSDQLAIIERIEPIIASLHGVLRTRLAAMQVHVAESLSSQRGQLTSDESAQLDRLAMRAYLSADQPLKAVAIGQRLAQDSAKDVDKQRELATLFGSVSQSDATTLCKQCWRRIESLTKPGSPEWLTARLNVLTCCVRLEQLDEARKLLQVTKVLYPELGGEPIKEKFDALGKALNSDKSR